MKSITSDECLPYEATTLILTFEKERCPLDLDFEVKRKEENTDIVLLVPDSFLSVESSVTEFISISLIILIDIF